ncbi:excisionase [Escherichia coli]|uniref:excisionase n=1 Tax=Escherichia coli TaxID=562 RepID=UPI003CCFF7C7
MSSQIKHSPGNPGRFSRWVRECRIFPPPVKDGREYLFHESAVKVDLNRPVTGSLLKRIRNGKKAKS